MVSIETIPYRGWARAVRLSNGLVEAVMSQEVGPRVLRFAFCGGANVFGEMSGQMGGTGEKDWKIRGGHRLWAAPQEQATTYEPDNEAVTIRRIAGGIRAIQTPSRLTGLQKSISLTLAPSTANATVVHRLANTGRRTIRLAPWALSVMAARGEAIIPLAPKMPHDACLTPTQVWSLWCYTDLSDPRWTIGQKYLRLRQDPRRGWTKLGLAHSMGWAAYWRAGLLFIKTIPFRDKVLYPDGGVNLEVYADQRILELESLGPLVELRPGRSVSHVENWALHASVPQYRSEAMIDRHIRPLALTGRAD